MYWSDVHRGTINRANLNGTNDEVLLTSSDPSICETIHYNVIFAFHSFVVHV